LTKGTSQVEKKTVSKLLRKKMYSQDTPQVGERAASKSMRKSISRNSVSVSSSCMSHRAAALFDLKVSD
jgi:hypothetical protein